jgi:RNA polymerase primary sigma factor
MVGLLTKWRRAERALCREAGRAPTFNEVAVRLGLSDTQKALVAKALQARQLKLENGIAMETVRRSVSGLNDQMASPDAVLEAADERRSLLARMERLDARERTILALRYGLEGERPLTLKEIGCRLGLTREWVRKIELRAVRKLDEEYDKGRTDGASRPREPRPTRRLRTAQASTTENPRAVTSSYGATLRRRGLPRALARSVRATDQPAHMLATSL